MSFQSLLAELDELTLAKSDPVEGGEGDNDDAAIAAAAEEGAEGEGEGEGEADAGEGEADAGEGDEDEDGEEFGKSFEFELANGEKVKAFDGTDLVKSLLGQVGELKATVEELSNPEGDLAKAIGGAVSLIKSQRTEIDLLKSQVADLGKSGRGRKATVFVAAKPEPEDLAKSEQPQGFTRDEFMMKAEAAFDAGKIRGIDVSIIETSLNKGMPVPENLRNRVLS